jgi:signal peptidase I
MVLVLAPAFLVKPYRIPSESMEPTLDVGQRVLVSRVNYKFGRSPGHNNIVVFHPPVGNRNGEDPSACGEAPPARADGQPCPQPTPGKDDVTFIKRVIGLPGDTVSIDTRGFATVNGKIQKQSFIRPCAQDCGFPKPITVPAGHYFMMGDNRGQSDDSRFWGPVPKKWIIGQAFATYWPPKRVGIF